jgi:hypothetical protein
MTYARSSESYKNADARTEFRHEGDVMDQAELDAQDRWDRKMAAEEQTRIRWKRFADAARDCGTSVDNPDTCGVCHLHFAECEADEWCVGDEVNEHDIPIGREPACPGARVRAALSVLSVK